MFLSIFTLLPGYNKTSRLSLEIKLVAYTSLDRNGVGWLWLPTCMAGAPFS